jgi:acyl dehydratase
MFAIKMALIGNMPSPFAVIASGGYDEVRFTAPIRAGDVVTLLMETVEARASKSKQDRGIVTLRLSLINQAGTVCMTHLDTIFVLRRSVIAS